MLWVLFLPFQWPQVNLSPCLYPAYQSSWAVQQECQSPHTESCFLLVVSACPCWRWAAPWRRLSGPVGPFHRKCSCPSSPWGCDLGSLPPGPLMASTGPMLSGHRSADVTTWQKDLLNWSTGYYSFKTSLFLYVSHAFIPSWVYHCN